MKFVLDSHTHTIASGHAYNTIREMVIAAKEKGLELLAITDHGPKMTGAFSEFYFVNFGAVEKNRLGVELLLGSEQWI
jgi:putative hydrolase